MGYCARDRHRPAVSTTVGQSWWIRLCWALWLVMLAAPIQAEPTPFPASKTSVAPGQTKSDAQQEEADDDDVPGKTSSETPPNIVVIMSDDVGYFNLGCYGGDLMGAATPNIDRIAREGLRLTSFYGHPTCTPSRAAFITGQFPIRTGLTTVGSPGSKIGLQAEDPTLAQVLKSMGYATGQFGKNHLGDRNEHLPTVHGFDEFWGNLYHLNAQEYEEDADTPRNIHIERRFGVRNVLDCVATDVDDPSEDLRFGRVGKQKIKDAGPLNAKRMEVIDDEALAKSLDFMDRQARARKPFFLYHNTNRMHVFLRIKEANRLRSRASEQDLFGAALAEHDDHVGEILKKIDQLGITKNTILVYVTDNGACEYMWPQGGTTPFRGQKGTTWEGGVRVPCLIRWPARIPAGQVSSQLAAMEDLFPTLVAAAGNPKIIQRLRRGAALNGQAYRVHLDGLNLLDFMTGEIDSIRKAVFYYDEARLTAIRYHQWKVHFAIKANGNWDDPLQELSVPYLFNLLMDPFERQTNDQGRQVREHKAWMFQPLVLILSDHADSFKKFPPRQKPDSFNVQEMMEKILKTADVSPHR